VRRTPAAIEEALRKVKALIRRKASDRARAAAIGGGGGRQREVQHLSDQSII
jgi:hypothetical protein